MTNAIRHRGPDDAGYHVSPFGVFLGHRRLSIVDLAAGHQPMRSQDGQCTIVYNGEIFNHADLRPELEQRGCRYVTRCDTETILHGWRELGPACLERFRGMFSFVIWDEATQTLSAARDRLGIKPFYYYWDGRVFAFASEIKALLEHPRVPCEPAEEQFAEYLAFGYLSGEATMFKGIRKLMPGHRLELCFRDAQPEPRLTCYWNHPPDAPREMSDEAWIAETRRRLEETVRLRLMADVPLGAFLSGGLDSSAVTALVQRMVDRPVQTFAVGYREAPYSELPYAARVSQMLGTEHREVVVGQDEFFQVLPRLIWQEDEPITWPSSVSLFFVSRLAAQHVKVVLTGEGSDELFGGYERYHWQMLNGRAQSVYGHLPEFLRGGVRRWIATSGLLNGGMRRKLGHTFLGREGTLESLYLDNFYAAFSAAEQKSWRVQGDVFAHYRRYWEARPELSDLGRLLYADQKTYLVELLMKQDQMSMATSIESRVPFLDHHFVAFAMSMPDHLKIRGGEQKYVLKKSVEDLLPKDIIYRKKMGFPTPLRQWFRDPASDPLLKPLLDPESFLAAYVDRDMVAGLLERHAAGHEDATDRLWRLLNLHWWGEIFFGRRRDELLEPSSHLFQTPISTP